MRRGGGEIGQSLAQRGRRADPRPDGQGFDAGAGMDVQRAPRLASCRDHGPGVLGQPLVGRQVQHMQHRRRGRIARRGRRPVDATGDAIASDHRNQRRARALVEVQPLDPPGGAVQGQAVAGLDPPHGRGRQVDDPRPPRRLVGGQHPARHGLGLGGDQHDGRVDVTRPLPHLTPHDQRARLIVARGVDEAQAQGLGRRLQRAGFHLQRRRLRPGQVVLGQRPDHPARARHHPHPRAALDRIQGEGFGQGHERIPQAHRPIDDIAAHRAARLARINGHPSPMAQGLDQLRQRRAAGPAGQPVAQQPVAAVVPDVRTGGKVGIGPRVPAPGAGPVDHAPAIERRHRIGVRLLQPGQHRFEVAPLAEVIALARRIRRQETLGAFGIDEEVGRIGALVDGRTAELGQADGLGHRDPGRGRRRAHAAGPVMVRMAPPGLQVLGPEHPGLAMGAVGDRCADLGVAVGRAGVEPVEVRSPRQTGAQIGQVVRPQMSRREIQMLVALAPVGDRRIPVDADEIDVRIGPQRIEMENRMARTIGRLVPEILAPVGGVADLGRRPEQTPDLGGQTLQLGDGRVAAVSAAHGGEAAQFRADDETLHAPGLDRQIGLVKHHAAQAPVAIEEGVHLGGRRRRALGAGLAGDPAAPRIGGLTRGRVHQDERIERDLQPAPLQLGDGLQHHRIGWRAAIGRKAVLA